MFQVDAQIFFWLSHRRHREMHDPLSTFTSLSLSGAKDPWLSNSKYSRICVTYEGFVQRKYEKIFPMLPMLLSVDCFVNSTPLTPYFLEVHLCFCLLEKYPSFLQCICSFASVKLTHKSSELSLISLKRDCRLGP